MPTILPNFLIIGAQKSGTTSMAYYLRAHPEVYLAPGKEVHYFNVNFDKGIEWYEAHFSGAGKQRAVGEATPMYMAHPEGPARMASVIPEARLIAILREPVARAYSHYWHNRAQQRESLKFADAVAAEPERIARNDPTERRHHYYNYLERGRYLEQLQRVCQYYPREALQVLLFEDLVKSPLETFRCVCRFLEIDDTVTPPNLGAALNKYTSAHSHNLRRVSSFLRTRRMRLLSRAIDRINVENTSYPPIDPALRAELQRQFAEDNAALAAWLGRDLSHWNSQPVTTS